MRMRVALAAALVAVLAGCTVELDQTAWDNCIDRTRFGFEDIAGDEPDEALTKAAEACLEIAERDVVAFNEAWSD